MGIVCAVLRNIHEGPTGAKSGSPARILEARASKLGLKTGSAEPYLAWRFSALILAMIMGLVRVIVVWLSISEGSDPYSDFLEEQLPPAVPAERFEDLVHFLKQEELAIWALSALGVLMTIGACCSSTPSIAFSRARMSRRFIWGSWLVTFLPPFLLFLVFPIRSLVDWDAIVADNCDATLRLTLRTDASLQVNLNILARSDETVTILRYFSSDFQAFAAIDVESKYDWCREAGADWRQKFYGTSLDCLWKVEDYCRGYVCASNDAQIQAAMAPNLGQCLTRCLTTAFGALSSFPTQAQQFLGRIESRIEECMEADRGFAGPVPRLARGQPISLSSPQEAVDFYEDLVDIQRFAIVNFAEASTLASLQTEYVVGMLISLIASKHLLPASLSVLAGLTEAFVNVKAMFLSQQQGAWALILITAQALPVYVALLAMFTQLLGDQALVAATVCAAFYVSVGMHTGKRLLVVGGGEEGLTKLHREQALDSALRSVFGLGVLAAGVFWAQTKGIGVEEYVRDDIFTPEVLAAALLDFLARKMVTVVAGTDAVLTGFLGSEAWFSKLPESDRDEHFAKVNDLCTATGAAETSGRLSLREDSVKPETIGGQTPADTEVTAPLAAETTDLAPDTVPVAESEPDESKELPQMTSGGGEGQEIVPLLPDEWEKPTASNAIPHQMATASNAIPTQLEEQAGHSRVVRKNTSSSFLFSCCKPDSATDNFEPVGVPRP